MNDCCKAPGRRVLIDVQQNALGRRLRLRTPCAHFRKRRFRSPPAARLRDSLRPETLKSNYFARLKEKGTSGPTFGRAAKAWSRPSSASSPSAEIEERH